MKAGTLRDRIQILRRSSGADSWGTPLPDAWEPISQTRIAADVQHGSGVSVIKADADVSVVRASIRIRRRTDVDAGMRVLFAGHIYEIEAVLPGKTRADIFLVSKRIQGPQP